MQYITSNFFNIDWNEKLTILNDIVTGLKNMHDANIIHKDYHSGNIFIKGYQAIIGDLGISKSAIDEKIYGVIQYIDYVGITDR